MQTGFQDGESRQGPHPRPGAAGPDEDDGGHGARTHFGGAPASRVAMARPRGTGHDEGRGKEPPMPRRCSRPVAAPVLAALAVGMVAGCGAVTSAKPAGAGTLGPTARSAPLTGCGTTRTAAGVPVEIEVDRGQVRC